MNVNIPLTADVENTLRRRAAAAGQDVGTYLRQFVIESLVEEEVPDVPRSGSHADFMARLHAIIAIHPVSNGLMDDSRESIYAGRGE